jgi:hypothetical protein
MGGVTVRHVLVGIPTLRSRMTAQLAGFLCMLPAQGHARGHPFTLQILPGVQPVHYARNVLVKALLESDAERLWFIDDDMVPDASAFEMLETDADIVVGRTWAYQTQKDGSKSLTIPAYPRRSTEGSGFQPVSAAIDTPAPIVAGGAGNLLVHRRVLEDPRLRLPSAYEDWEGNHRVLEDDADEAPAIFRTVQAPNGRTLLSEDIDFVHRAACLGYRCTYQPHARMGHFKTVDLADIEQYVRDAVARAGSHERAVARHADGAVPQHDFPPTEPAHDRLDA